VEAFAPAFGSTLSALVQVFLVVVGAGLLVRTRLVGQRDISTLSKLSVMVFLPCLIFSNVLTNLDPGAMPLWLAVWEVLTG
jgi:predicted permease